MSDRVVVGMTGATGQRYGICALELLADSDCTSHLILSNAAVTTIGHETSYSASEIRDLADEVYAVENIGAATASGSFNTNGMLVAPCSMKTLSNIAHGNASDLITRSADVTLKERRPLVLLPREKPFNRIHLQNMLTVTDAGGMIFPPFPSFYQQTMDIDEMIRRTTARALTHVGVSMEYDEWGGLSADE